MKFKLFALAVAVLSAPSMANATVIGFGEIGNSNTTVPANLGSNATVDGSGFVIAGNATPNVALTWDTNWDIHTSGFFNEIEDQTAGGGDWDNQGSIPRVGQMDSDNHTIDFTVDSGFQLMLNSFDFALTSEGTDNATTWTLSLSNSANSVVWDTTINFDNQTANVADRLLTVTPGFIGADGEDYTLEFDRTADLTGGNGRHAIDNLSFSQATAVPEPGSVAMLALGSLGLAASRRRRRNA